MPAAQSSVNGPRHCPGLALVQEQLLHATPCALPPPSLLPPLRRYGEWDGWASGDDMYDMADHIRYVSRSARAAHAAHAELSWVAPTGWCAVLACTKSSRQRAPGRHAGERALTALSQRLRLQGDGGGPRLDSAGAAAQLRPAPALGGGLLVQGCSKEECSGGRGPKLPVPIYASAPSRCCPMHPPPLPMQPFVFRYAPDVQHSGFESFTVKFAHGAPAHTLLL